MVLKIILVFFYILSIIISIKLILENRDPSKTLIWILIFMLFPVIGILFYAILGRNIRKIKMKKTYKMANNMKKENILFNLDEMKELAQGQSTMIKEGKLPYGKNIDFRVLKIVSLLLNTGIFPFTINNNVEIYVDGNEKFKNLIKDIRNAKDHIHLEYFIIKDSKIGEKIKKELIDKAKSGVKIRIIYDDVGCWRFWFHRKFFNEMRTYGIEIIPYLKGKITIPIGGQLNYRNHRKIVVIDGKIGYTGGINIGDEYIGKNKKFGYWRDTHIRIEGTSVYMLQMIFLTDWYYNTKKVLLKENLFPKLKDKGSCMMQIVASGPDSDWESMHYAYFYAICQAKKSIYIETPYFIPDESLLKALKCAALSGVELIILFPKIADHKIVNTASYSYFQEILESGGKVYLYNKGFLHSKLIIIDDFMASTGSANMDLRSFKLNFEVNAFIYDENIIDEIKKKFLEDLKHGKELKQNMFENRKIVNKIKESVCRLFSPIL
ncbi:MAG TPA: cardiolipin synthase [Terrisporobacter glycolicus]|uniref:cardiolipin synthase n=1 Tax=Terrisporobacter TaxID=1505652 RepID=UPI000E954D1E|nr:MULTISPECIES: cardiolipin synthase [Terrisporobacter]MBN9648906.1 cardiolipin synthase [Terrisporobacter glycolicus]HBI91101.1 cardiolipin synthase [Terrisporobacter hibernicus]